MLKKLKLLSLITAVCFICAAIIPCTFAEAEVVTLENIEVGGDEVQYVYLHTASQGKDSECEIVSGEIPGGMALSFEPDETGEGGRWYIYGNPEKAGMYSFTIRYFGASDTTGITESYSITVFDIIFDEGTVLDSYSDTIIFDSQNTYVCELVSGSLPNGLYISHGESEGTDESGDWFIFGAPTEIGDFTPNIKITGKDGEKTLACFLKVNDRPMLSSDECELYGDFEGELLGWTNEGFEQVKTENAYEGESVMKATAKSTLISPVIKVRNNSLLTWYTNAPEGDGYSVYIHEGSEDAPITEYELVGHYKSTGKWAPAIKELDGQNVRIAFCYDGEAEFMLDFVTVSKGYDHMTVIDEKMHCGFYSEMNIFSYSSSSFILRGDLPLGVELVSVPDGNMTAYSLKGIPSKGQAGAYYFTIEFLSEDGKTEHIEEFSLSVLDIKLGDLTGNGLIETGDAVIVLRYVVGLCDLTDIQKAAADVNSDGKINTSDAVSILRISVGLDV